MKLYTSIILLTLCLSTVFGEWHQSRKDAQHSNFDPKTVGGSGWTVNELNGMKGPAEIILSDDFVIAYGKGRGFCYAPIINFYNRVDGQYLSSITAYCEATASSILADKTHQGIAGIMDPIGNPDNTYFVSQDGLVSYLNQTGMIISSFFIDENKLVINVNHDIYTSNDTTLVLIDMSTGKDVWKLEGTVNEAVYHDGVIYGLSPNSDYILLIDASTGTMKKRIPNEGSGHNIQVTPDGQTIIISEYTSEEKWTVLAYNAVTGSCIWKLKTDLELYSPTETRSAIDQTGKYLALASFYRKEALIVDISSGNIIRKIPGPFTYVVGIDKQNNLVLFAAGTVQKYNISSGALLKSITVDTYAQCVLDETSLYCVSPSTGVHRIMW
eukprot:TRINITY_DN952_c0_g2_i2.p1 TRINITY_DN952_c0_g2~~TRINITY_DN952_c0_g2_i2.p1  ORF type:complete len:383 (-),score=70.48 TRINITY_DN952_c0_g2_i2:29-1177(-)